MSEPSPNTNADTTQPSGNDPEWFTVPDPVVYGHSMPHLPNVPFRPSSAERITLAAGSVHPDVAFADIMDDTPRYVCTLIEAGPTLNGWTLPPDVLAAATDKFRAAPVQIDHPGWFEPARLSAFAGTIETPAYQDGSVSATLRIAETPSGSLLQRIFDAWLEDQKAGLEVAPIGLSAVLWLHFEQIEGETTCTDIYMVESVDAVLHPAAGGRVERVLNALSHPQGDSPPTIERSTNMPEERTNTNPSSRTAPPQADRPQPVSDNGGEQAQPSPPETPEISLQEALATIESVADRVADLTGQVEALSQIVASDEAERTVTGLGEPPRDNLSIRMGRSGLEQVEEALDALLEGRHPSPGVQPLTGIRELYMLLSGDYEMTGRFHQDRVYLSNVNSSTMAALVANRLNKAVVNQFMNYPHWWAPIVVEMDFSTLQDARWITLGGVGELPTVTEGSAYTELTWDDNTETAAFVKKGGYLGITIEAIDKDDTRRLRMAPQALAQAAWLTLGKSISNIFTQSSGVGPDLADAIALFNASHSNLGTTALSHSAWDDTRQAMRDQTEINSGEALGALTAPRYLLVPNELELTALQVLATEHTPASADYNVNPYAEGDARMARLASARERVIVIDLWTDANNWAAVADPQMYPSLAVGYRYGRTPEIFSVASPTAGLMFSNDVMPVKIRFFYAAGVVDYRGLYKHNVT